MPSLFAVRDAPLLLSKDSDVGVTGVGVPFDSAMEALRVAANTFQNLSHYPMCMYCHETYEEPLS